MWCSTARHVLDARVDFRGGNIPNVGGLCHGHPMSESQPESLSGRTFRNRSLRETKFIGCDPSEVVVRAAAALAG